MNLYILIALFAATTLTSGSALNSTIMTSWSQEYLIETIGSLPEGPVVRITNRNTRKCVDNKNASGGNGSQTQMYECNGTVAQMWIKIRQGDYFQLKNVGSGKCIDIKDRSVSNGGRLHQWTCGSQTSQHWKEHTAYHIIGRHSGKCIDIYEQNAGNGKALHIWNCKYT